MFLLRLILAFFSIVSSQVFPNARNLEASFVHRDDEVQIRVSRTGDMPVAGATALVLDSDGETLAEGRTNIKGCWSFRIPYGKMYTVHVQDGPNLNDQITLTFLPEDKETIEERTTDSLTPKPDLPLCCKNHRTDISYTQQEPDWDSPSTITSSEILGLLCLIISGLVYCYYWQKRLHMLQQKNR